MYNKKEHNFKFRLKNKTQYDLEISHSFKDDKIDNIHISVFSFKDKEFIVDRTFPSAEEYSAIELFKILFDIMKNTFEYDEILEYYYEYRVIYAKQ